VQVEKILAGNTFSSGRNAKIWELAAKRSQKRHTAETTETERGKRSAETGNAGSESVLAK
jgi:hypothetical protein